MAVDLSRILTILNNSGIQKDNLALYQVIKSLIDGTSQIQNQVTVQFSNLNTSLTNTFTYGLAADKANYKPQSTIGGLVFYYETDTGNLYLFDRGTDTWESIGAPIDATYLTETDESADLPNSRRVLEGVGIDFNDATANVRVVNLEIHPFLLMGA
jgi:hypothetical protein